MTPEHEIYFNDLDDSHQWDITKVFADMIKVKKKNVLLRMFRLVNPKMKVKFINAGKVITAFEFMEESKPVIMVELRNYIHEMI